MKNEDVAAMLVGSGIWDLGQGQGARGITAPSGITHSHVLFSYENLSDVVFWLGLYTDLLCFAN